MKVDRKVVEDYEYTVVMNGKEFSLIRQALFSVTIDEDHSKPYRDDCRAVYAAMVKTEPSVV